MIDTHHQDYSIVVAVVAVDKNSEDFFVDVNESMDNLNDENKMELVDDVDVVVVVVVAVAAAAAAAVVVVVDDDDDEDLFRKVVELV